jgi:hypothetical protein
VASPLYADDFADEMTDAQKIELDRLLGNRPVGTSYIFFYGSEHCFLILCDKTEVADLPREPWDDREHLPNGEHISSSEAGSIYRQGRDFYFSDGCGNDQSYVVRNWFPEEFLWHEESWRAVHWRQDCMATFL